MSENAKHPTCPACGAENPDDEYSLEVGEPTAWTCYSCGAEFVVTKHVSVSYDSRPVYCAAGDHAWAHKVSWTRDRAFDPHGRTGRPPVIGSFSTAGWVQLPEEEWTATHKYVCAKCQASAYASTAVGARAPVQPDREPAEVEHV